MTDEQMSGLSRLARAATGYAKRGWHVFPLRPRDKRPLHAGAGGFYEATDDVTVVTHWWTDQPDANIGLWPGPSGCAVLDIDGEEIAQRAQGLGVFDVATLECQTGREGGRHLYFQRPEFTVANSKLEHPYRRLDVRCDDGYVVAPPSIHPSGRVYGWTHRGAGIQPLPSALRELLHAAQSRCEADEDTESPGTPLVLSPDELLDRRVRAYIAKVGQFAEGQGRNNAAYQIAAFLTHDMALADDPGFAYLAEWNRGNMPPLQSRELKTVFHSARKTGQRGRGVGLERAERLTHAAWIRDVERARREASA